MPGTICEQSKRAIDKMKAAGFKRSEFRVRTETKSYKMNDGRRAYEYGDALISCHASRDRQMEMIDAMVEAGLNVEVSHYMASPDRKEINIVLIDDNWRGADRKRLGMSDDDEGMNLGVQDMTRLIAFNENATIDMEKEHGPRETW